MFQMCRCGQFIVAVALLTGCAAAQSDVAEAVERCSLDIMLTNDDGWNAPGIQTVRGALLTAGHRVTLVGPLEQQSGRGGAINTHVGSEVGVVEQAPGVWSVDGTPTDAVRAGLGTILHDNWPDLVVSGSNFGPNLGQEGVHNSGTLGATLAAIYDGLPAIAISTGIDIKESETSPPFKSTFAGFETSAAIVVNVIDSMTARYGCDDVMPDNLALNINVPVHTESIQGIRYAPLSKLNLFRMHWSWSDTDGKALIGYRETDLSLGDPGDDINLFALGYVTVTPINGDVTIEALPSSVGLPSQLTGLLPTELASQ
ncbi:MAG: 5'/3'-nucleotidase SurE [Gammaproteobacteria bacterium]|nr:5'/3'-nucleotidase SurE [Gammaproteobacteria bacterium]